MDSRHGGAWTGLPLARIEKELAGRLEALGLFVFGWFRLEASDCLGEPQSRLFGRIDGKAAGVLVGNRFRDGNHEMWERFCLSREYADGQPHPMDRWTERMVSPIADDMGAQALYPFGDHVWPFQRFAMRATGMQASPLGMLIHPEYGLWQAFRAALVFPQVEDVPAPPSVPPPCKSCAAKPCLRACPVEAFKPDGFAVADCRDHLSSGEQPVCMAIGCRARAACPVGTPYCDAQIRFHMRSFEGG